MELKTYRAANMADALTQVKKDLGKDAVILHARTLKLGGVMGVGARTVVEITASSDARAAAPRMRASQPVQARVPGETVASGRAGAAPMLAASATAIPAVARAYAGGGEPPRADARPPRTPIRDSATNSARGARGARSVATDASAEGFVPLVSTILDSNTISPHPVSHREISTGLGTHGRVPVPPRSSTNPLATRVEISPMDQAARSAIESELASIKQLVGEVLNYSKRSGPGRQDPPSDQSIPASFRPFVEALRFHGLAPHLIDECVQSAQSVISGPSTAESDRIARCVREALGEMIPVSRLPETMRADATGRPTVLALVGPTGGGKTTTIAKLAADYRLRRGLRVGILAADTYRIAAVEQLRTYAGIIGVPLHVVHAPTDVEVALAALRGMDVVLLDTAGRSQRDRERLSELEATLAAASPDHTLLVLSTTVSEPVMQQAAERFMGLRPSGLILTKLDEAIQMGPAVNIARKLAIGICCLTDGQDVPDNIEPANADRIAGLLLEAGEP